MHADCRRMTGAVSLQRLVSDDSLLFRFEPCTSFRHVSVHLIEEVGKRSPTVYSSLLLFSSLFSLLALHLSSCLFDLLPARRRDNILDEPSADKLMPAAALQRILLFRVADHFVPQSECSRG